MRKKWGGLLIISFMLLFVSACSSGDSSSSSSVPTADATDAIEESTVTGTAAAGAPIVGTVNIKGADGEISRSAIRADGSYTVDVAALTAPFLIWAEGTANGKKVRLYSTVQTAGQVANVTPATNMVVTMALGADPADVYGAVGEGDDVKAAAFPEAEAIVAAAADVNALLASVFASLEMPADFDLMNGAFVADGSDFDSILDTVSFQVDSTDADNLTVIVTDNSTEEVLYEENVATNTVVTQLTPEEVVSIVADGLTFQEKALAVVKKIEALYATAVPTAAEMEAELGPFIASGFLDYGMNGADMFAEWVREDGEAPSVGVTIDAISILGPMEDQPLGGDVTLSPMPGYDEGYWCRMTVTEDGMTESFLTSFVRDSSGVVKWYGDRNPFMNGTEADAQAVRHIDPNGTTMWSGLDLWMSDEGNAVLDTFGIDAVLILHPSLPDLTLADGSTVVQGLVMARTAVNTDYSIRSTTTQYWGMFTDVDGLDITKINAGDKVVFVGLDRFDDTTWEPLASPVAKSVWVDVMYARPLATSALTAAHFAEITSPVLTTPSDATIPGEITLSWTMPTAYSDPIADWAAIWWSDQDYNYDQMDSDIDSTTVTTATFDTSATTVYPTGHVGMEIGVKDPVTGREYSTRVSLWSESASSTGM